MKIDLSKYDDEHAKRIEELTKKVRNVYNSIIRQVVKYGLSVNFDPEKGDIFDFDKFPKLKKAIEELFLGMHDDLLSLVESYIAVEWALSDEKNAYLLEKIMEGTKLSKEELESLKPRNDEALSAFLKRTHNGMNLSDRVWKLTKQFKTELELALSVGIEQGKSAQQLSRDIRSYLNQLDKLFRRVRNQYGNLKLSKAAEAYHPGQGVYRSSYKNAMRVTRTEVNMAYRSADYERWNDEYFVIGIEIRLSNNHTCNGEPFFDICDILKGKYPKSFKFTGWHPMCKCYAVPILCSWEEQLDYMKKRRDGEDVSGYKFKEEVTELPKAFTDWMGANASRISRWKSKPYFIEDNKALIYPRQRIELTDEQKAYRKELQKKAIEKFKGTVVENVFRIEISGASIKEYLNQPHKHYFEKNELVLVIDKMLQEAKYLGINPTYKKESVKYSHIYETNIMNEISWLIVREYTDGRIIFHSCSDDLNIAGNLIKNKP